MTEYVAAGNTYKAREALRKAGFCWDAERKEWTGDETAKAEIVRITSPAYGMTYRKLMADCRIEEVRR